MKPEEYFKIAKEVAKPLYHQIELEIKEKLLENNSDTYYTIVVSDELKLLIEKNYAVWETVASMYKDDGWSDVYYNYSFFRRKLTITFCKEPTGYDPD